MYFDGARVFIFISTRAFLCLCNGHTAGTCVKYGADFRSAAAESNLYEIEAGNKNARKTRKHEIRTICNNGAPAIRGNSWQFRYDGYGRPRARDLPPSDTVLCQSISRVCEMRSENIFGMISIFLPHGFDRLQFIAGFIPRHNT